jgi:DtxR family transcriptional regulator, Mn-dependent transcriptional regulator
VSDLIDTTEMYLRTIFELEEEGIVPLRARIAERLGHSGPTVSQTVARMERDGLLHVTGDRHLELTGDGRQKATRVMRKHRLAERLLVDVVGLEWEFVHEEACRWEHVMSERVERKLMQILDHPTSSPYGNPIPGLDELGETDEAEVFLGDGLRQLSEAAGPAVITVVVHRIGEPAQADPEALAELRRAGLRPGEKVHVRRDGPRVLVTAADGRETDVHRAVAEHVFVGSV